MSTPFLAVLSLILFVALVKVWSAWRRSRRADSIRTYLFPPGLLERFGSRYPELSAKERHLVARALRQFFLAYLKSGRAFVSMPSQVVDDLWHEFILYTRHYSVFCNQAFGRFMHHTPAVVLGPNSQNNAGLRRTWWHACLEENINLRKPTRLPLLFALDEKLNIEDSFAMRSIAAVSDATRAAPPFTAAAICPAPMSMARPTASEIPFSAMGAAVAVVVAGEIEPLNRASLIVRRRARLGKATKRRFLLWARFSCWRLEADSFFKFRGGHVDVFTPFLVIHVDSRPLGNWAFSVRSSQCRVRLPDG